jgi:stage II sporulation protein D
MKRFLISVFVLVFLIIGIPALVAFIGGLYKTPVAPPLESSHKTSVLFVDSGETSEVDIEEYLIGVVAAEMPASFHIEALKAQAVAARTYIFNKEGESSEQHPQADVCTDSTHCKAWLSYDQLAAANGQDWIDGYYDKIKQSVSETEGIVMLYNAEPIQAVFHSTGSGKTENAEDVWGNSVPYLVSVDSPGDLESPKYKTEVNMKITEAADLISNFCGEKIEFTVGDIQKAGSGLVKEIMIGGKAFSGNDIRTALSLPSSNFEIIVEGEQVLITVLGFGHGVGLSQYGANYLAEHGKTYDEILKQYYTGVTVEKYTGS